MLKTFTFGEINKEGSSVKLPPTNASTEMDSSGRFI